MNKFWEFKNENNNRELFLNGIIAETSWWGDEITPSLFKEELNKEQGDLTVWLCSDGGDVFAAAQIYDMLMNYKGNVTVKITGRAASAATVIAMAGTEVLMSPTAIFMIHNPSLLVNGDKETMKKAQELLDEVKETIINAYELRSNLSRKEISKLMDNETWMSAQKAVELGFVDGILYDEKDEGILVSRQEIMTAVQNASNSFVSKLQELIPQKQGKKISDLQSRLNLIRSV